MKEWLKEHSFKPGESGNPAGRPTGSRNQLTEDFLKDFHESWKRNGKEAIEALCADSPKDYVKVALEITKASIPKQVNLKDEREESNLASLTTEQLAAVIALADTMAELGGGSAKGVEATGDGNKPAGVH